MSSTIVFFQNLSNIFYWNLQYHSCIYIISFATFNAIASKYFKPLCCAHMHNFIEIQAVIDE